MNMLFSKYNTSSVYCRELAPGTISFTSDWDRGDDSKQYRYLPGHAIYLFCIRQMRHHT